MDGWGERRTQLHIFKNLVGGENIHDGWPADSHGDINNPDEGEYWSYLAIVALPKNKVKAKSQSEHRDHAQGGPDCDRKVGPPMCSVCHIHCYEPFTAPCERKAGPPTLCQSIFSLCRHHPNWRVARKSNLIPDFRPSPNKTDKTQSKKKRKKGIKRRNKIS